MELCQGEVIKIKAAKLTLGIRRRKNWKQDPPRVIRYKSNVSGSKIPRHGLWEVGKMCEKALLELVCHFC